MRGRPRGKSEKTMDLIDAAREILEEIQPASVRAVAYKLFVAGVIHDMSTAETQRVSRALVAAREEGWISWDWIVDDTREVREWQTWSNAAECMRYYVRTFRLEFWNYQPHKVMVVSEKATVEGTLDPVLSEYGIDFLPVKGWNSATAMHRLATMDTHEGHLVLLYLGDHDPSGVFMSEVDMPERLQRYGDGDVDLVRVAITREDVAAGQLPSFSAATKRKDPRYRWFAARYGDRCVELDAMSPPDLRSRVESYILYYIDLEAWERCRLAAEAERDTFETVLAAVNGNKVKQDSE